MHTDLSLVVQVYALYEANVFLNRRSSHILVFTSVN